MVKRKDKVVKDNGSYIFSDFSYGLYLLDTPRYLTEQLGSLALVGGRNVWSEKGALTAQYGTITKENIPLKAPILNISKDTKGTSSIFVVAGDGTVYLYSVSEGLKRFETKLQDPTDDLLIARKGGDLYTYYGGSLHLFGGYYAESDFVEIANNVKCADFGTFIEVEIPIDKKDLIWVGKQLEVEDHGQFTVNSLKEGEGYIYTDFTFSDLSQYEDWKIVGNLYAGNNNKQIKICSNPLTAIDIQTQTIEESSTETKTTVEYECYKMVTPFPNGSTMYEGYVYVKPNPKAGSKIYATNHVYVNTSTFTFRLNSTVVTSSSKLTELKVDTYKYKDEYQGTGNTITVTSVGSNGTLYVGDVSQTHSTLTRYKSGDIATTETIVTPIGTKTVRNVTVTLPMNNGTTETFSTENLQEGSYEYDIIRNHVENTITFKLIRSSNTIYSKTVSGNLLAIDEAPYALVGNGEESLILYIGDEIENKVLADVLIARMSPRVNYQGGIPERVNIGEKCSIEVPVIYTPEDKNATDLPYKKDSKGNPYYVVTPRLMEWCSNRLLVEDVTGNIFYSQVGTVYRYDDNQEIVSAFDEAQNAGYFGGFYNDNSNLLDLDDFKDGILITKENGLYYLTIKTQTSLQSVSGSYLTITSNDVNIEKISEIGQQYRQDHCIVGNEVYAYDSHSGALVKAITQTVFGALVAGKPLVSADYLRSRDLGIADAPRRCLVYNAEAGVFTLYYGQDLKQGIVYVPSTDGLFPRELKNPNDYCTMLNEGVCLIDVAANISEDFKKGTIIEDVEPYADFEAIGLRDNRFINCSVMEITELNGINYNILTTNIAASNQKVVPNTDIGYNNTLYPPMLYSEYGNTFASTKLFDTFGQLEGDDPDQGIPLAKWAEKSSNMTRIYAPMSGRFGVGITVLFPKNEDFCLAAIRLPDFSQGE